MLTNDERIKNLEASVVKLKHDTDDLATDDELDAVVTQVFDKQEELASRIQTLKHNMALVKEILSSAQG